MYSFKIDSDVGITLCRLYYVSKSDDPCIHASNIGSIIDTLR